MPLEYKINPHTLLMNACQSACLRLVKYYYTHKASVR